MLITIGWIKFSYLSGIIQLLCMLPVIIFGFYCLRWGKPHPTLKQITYLEKGWQLTYEDKILEDYQLEILLSTPLFNLLKFSKEEQATQTLVLFLDQLSQAQWRHLFIFNLQNKL